MTIGVVFIFLLPGTADWHVPQASPIKVVNRGGVISGGGVQPPKPRLDRVRTTGGPGFRATGSKVRYWRASL